MNFKEVSVSDMLKADAIWAPSSNVSKTIFVQCDKNGVHKPLKDIQRIWYPMDIIRRFSQKKPTQIFFKDKKE